MRIGFLGAGLIATFHSKMLRASGEDVIRAGVFDPDRRRAEAFAAASGHHVCPSELDVLDDCDAVYICTWTSEHLRLVRAAADRGLAIFCEKPLATNLSDARAMAAAVEGAGVTNQVGLVLRRSPAFVVLRERLRERGAGRLMSVVFRDDQYIPIRGAYASTWRGDVAKAGAGTLIEHSIHDLDLLDWVAGPVTSVAGQRSYFHGIDGIEDLAVATLGLGDHAIGSLTSVWHDIDSRPSLRRVEVFCERAWFSVEGDWFGPLAWTLADGSSGVLDGESLVDEARRITGEDANPDGAFVRAARSGADAHPSFAVAVRAHELADAFYRSAGTGGAPVPT